jgi:hypothetical protein
MRAIEQLKQHSTIITSFVAGATSAIAAGYLYCRIVHRRKELITHTVASTVPATLETVNN